MKTIELLQKGAQDLGLTLSQQQAKKLLLYFEELVRWNKKINLSGIRELEPMLDLHGLDSLSIHESIYGKTVVDVGSGAGLPGIPLALIMPERRFCLLDSNSKKTRFLVHVIGLLDLKNLDVVQQRVEDFQPDQVFDTVVCRAFASLDKIIRLAGHLCGSEGRLLAMKGKYPHEELEQLPKGWVCKDCISLKVPRMSGTGFLGDRHLVVMQRVSISM